MLQTQSLVLIHGDAGSCRLLFNLHFLGGHRLVHPLIGSLLICRAGSRVAAFQVGLFAVEQINVRHRIVIVGTQLQCFVQAVESILNDLPNLRPSGFGKLSCP